MRSGPAPSRSCPGRHNNWTAVRHAAPVNGRPRMLVAPRPTRQIDLFISYCSGARAIVKASSKYKSVGLPPELTVGAEYGLTVSRKAAPDAADFAMYLLSPQGESSLQSFGLFRSRCRRRSSFALTYHHPSLRAQRSNP